jgi:hypothetical protein
MEEDHKKIKNGRRPQKNKNGRHQAQLKKINLNWL